MNNKIKYITIIILVISLSIKGHCQEIKFITQNWDSAVALAKNENKDLFVFCITDGCGWCTKMENTTFKDKEIVKLINEKYICYLVNIDYYNYDFTSTPFTAKKINRTNKEYEFIMNLTCKYYVDGVPTSFIFTNKLQFVNQIDGYQKPVDFHNKILKNLSRSDSINKSGLLNEFGWKYSPEFFELFKNSKFFRDDSLVSNFLIKQKDLFSLENWYAIVKSPVLYYNNEIKSFFLNNIPKYKKIYGKDKVNILIDNLADQILRKAIHKKDTSVLNNVIKFIDKYSDDKKPSSKIPYYLAYYEKIKDWNSYFKTFEDWEKSDTASFSGYNINEYCWNVYKNSSDMKLINNAIIRMENIINHDAQYEWLDTYAALLFKAKRFKEAEVWAIKAIDLGKAQNGNFESTEKLLKRIKEKI